jgi:PAS domain S-box-containing protein
MNGKNGGITIEAFQEGTGDGACAVGRDGVIIGWNAGAEQILGYKADEAVGKTCAEIFDGRDPAGNLTCTEFCTVRSHAKRCEPLQHFQLRTRRRDGKPVWLDVSIVLFGKDACAARLHLFRDVTAAHEIEHILREKLLLPRTPSGQPARLDLTRREIQVLRLMKEGATTHAIANSLYVSRATVRNHIQHIFAKLEVHNRLEAVAAANRCGL